MNNALEEQIELAEQLTVIEDGLIIDAGTGEVLGEAEAQLPVLSEEEVAEVLRRIMRADARVARVQSTEEYLCAKSVVANTERVVKREKAKADYWRFAYGQLLGHYAASRLGGGSRTLVTPHGSIALRATPEAVKLRKGEEDAAIEWATGNAPNAIKTEYSFLISRLTPEQKELAKTVPAFEVIPAHDAVTIETLAPSKGKK